MELAVDNYLDACFEKKIVIQLVWPGRPHNPILFHALAALRLRGGPQERGLRGFFYPSKLSTGYSLNKYHIDARALLQWAREEARHEKARHGDYSAETIVLMGLRDLLKKSDDREEGDIFRHPNLCDIVLHFRPILDRGEVWPNVCDHLFLGLRREMGLRKRIGLNNAKLYEMAAPDKAKDAVFHLPRMSNIADIKKLLSSKIFVENPPQILLFDATRQSEAGFAFNMRTYVPKLIKAAFETFRPRFPGIYVVTDNPVMATNLQYDILKQVQKWKSPDGDKIEIKVQKFTIDWPYKDHGFNQPFLLPPTEAFKHQKIRVEGVSIGRLHKRIYDICNMLRKRSLNEALRQLQETNRFLRRATTLPCSRLELNKWLLDSDLSDEAMESYGRNFIWKTHAIALQRIVTETEAAVVLPKVRSLMEEIERFLVVFENGTPIANAICEEIQWALKNTTGRVTIVFPKWYHAMLSEQYLQSRRIGEGKDNHRVDYRYGKIPDELFEDQSVGTLILACNPEEHLELLLSRDFNAWLETILIFDVEGAKKGCKLIEMVLKEDQLAAYHNRAKAIQRELEKVPHGLLKFPIIGDLDRAFKFSGNTYSEKDSAVHKETDQVVIRFADRSPIVCGCDSRFRVYDPESWSAPKFIIKNAKDLLAGEQVFLMPDDLRSEIEMLLRSGGTQSVQYDLLNEYHKEIARLAASIPGNKVSVAKMVYKRMCIIDPAMESQENVTNVLRWLNVEKLKDIPVEKRIPQAPRQYRHFRAFAQAISIEELMANTYWHYSICSIRRDRIEEGREAGEFFTNLLFDETIAKMRSGITIAQIDALRTRAIDNLYQILQVQV